jgi:hypothetical protein
MSELSKNQLVTRRGFFRRASQTATLIGAGGALVALKSAAPANPGKANPWAYDLSAFQKTDPKLIAYSQLASFTVGRASPRCIALADERLFVAAGKYITEFALDGTQLSEIALAAEPRSLEVDGEGLLYTGLREHVEVYDRKGQRRARWDSPGQRAYFTGLAIGKNDLFVADAGNRVVLRYDLSGKLVSRIGERNKERNIPGFIVPSPFFDVELARDGLLRVTNPGRHRVEAYTIEGDHELAWGRAGAAIENFCGCCNPINLALLPDGRHVTFEKGLPRVKVYSADGVFESVVAGVESFGENAKVCGPNDCTLGGLDGVVDAQGRIYILDLVSNEVRVMGRKA